MASTIPQTTSTAQAPLAAPDTSKQPVLQVLDTAALRAIAAHPGPWVTVFTSACRGADRHGFPGGQLKSQIRQARERLAATGFTGDLEVFFAPLEELARQCQGQPGTPGMVLFRSPGFMGAYEASWLDQDGVTVGKYPQMIPLLRHAQTPNEFLILALSRKHLKLLQYSGGQCRELTLPEKVPTSIEQAGEFDAPDHQLANRSSAGPSTGTMGGVYFGTLYERERSHLRVHELFTIVDRELRETLAGKPLLLFGVREEVLVYRQAATYDNLMMSEEYGSADALTPAQIAVRAGLAAYEHQARVAAAAFALHFPSDENRGRTLSDVPGILAAAQAGRVHRLFLREGTQSPDFIAGKEQEDPVNVATVETFRKGGEVFALPQEKMIAGRPIAAVLRY